MDMDLEVDETSFKPLFLRLGLYFIHFIKFAEDVWAEIGKECCLFPLNFFFTIKFPLIADDTEWQK